MLSLLNGLRARPRLLAGLAAGILVGLTVPVQSLSVRLLLGWNAGIAVHLVLIVVMMARAREGDLQRRADREDAGAAAILGIFAVAVLASFAAVAIELREARSEGSALAAGGAALAGCTVLLSWLFTHALFGLHYAHDYYAGEEDRGGLKFPGKEKPDYWDFQYFAFNLGAAAQTSDVLIEAARIRRMVLAHTILSFLFNTCVLALAINVGAGLLGGS